RQQSAATEGDWTKRRSSLLVAKRARVGDRLGRLPDLRHGYRRKAPSSTDLESRLRTEGGHRRRRTHLVTERKANRLRERPRHVFLRLVEQVDRFLRDLRHGCQGPQPTRPDAPIVRAAFSSLDEVCRG